MDNICPSLFHMGLAYTDERKTTENVSDDFEIQKVESLTQIQKLRLNADISLFVRLLCCHHVKNQEKNYCAIRRNAAATAPVCQITNKPKWTHFHIFPKPSSEVEATEYLLSFIENTDFTSNLDNIIAEQYALAKWLHISCPIIYLYILTYGEPVYKTYNNSHREQLINVSLEKKASQVSPKFIPATLNIKQKDKSLSIFLSSKRLSFNAS